VYEAYRRLNDKALEALPGIDNRFATLSEKKRDEISRLFIADLIMSQGIPIYAMRWEMANEGDMAALLELLSFDADASLRSFYARKISEEASGNNEDLPHDLAEILEECPAFTCYAL